MRSLLTMLFTGIYISMSFSQNYDESKVPFYTLPSLLVSGQNQPIKDTASWEHARRPELLTLFSNYVYGTTPKDFDSVRFGIENEDPAAMNGKARLKEVAIRVYRQNKSITFHLVLFTPTAQASPAAVFVLINNRGRSHTDPKRVVQSDFWPAEMMIDSGYGIAAFHVSELAPDRKDSYADALLQLYPEQLAADNGMKAIGAWAFGASRVMDYLVTDGHVNAKQVVIVGHSRGGKTALWAAAQDERFSLCISNCSGNTGAALARRQFGERIAKINATFPHWFCNNYKRFNDNETALPVDQHMLIALIAPRPVYATNATEDLWADPKGTFLALKNAEPAYALYHKKSNLPADPPSPGHAILYAPLGYHNRIGVHDMTRFDWIQFIQFARHHFRS
ncbi:alpha/beta hydrolase [Filimonas effusa]|uniref:Alpha/beta hydrolase n=2 Tax=Filimonas effusa TaxID=2508721 RepID=A0A4Q1D6A0_9BACT|nr:alpha/beta hydrolase [Filimonas effusa]